MKKQLLNETEVRSFMKFANLQPLAETFFDRLEEDDITEGDDDLETPEFTDDGAGGPVGDEPVDDEPVVDEPVGDEVPGDEVPGEEATSEVTWALSEEEAGIVAPVLMDLASQVEQLAGTGEEEPGADVMEPEVDLEAPPAEEAGLDPGLPPEDEEDMVGALAESDLYVSEGGANDLKKVDVVNEVARRVAKRLVAATRKSKTRKRK